MEATKENVRSSTDKRERIYDKERKINMGKILSDIDNTFNITEELCSLIPMQGTTTGKDLYDELKSVLENFSILLEKIIGISTDGARAMSSMEVGVSGRLFQDIKKVTGREIFVNHCIMHQENLCAKRLSLPNVTVPIIKLINFIVARVKSP